MAKTTAAAATEEEKPTITVEEAEAAKSAALEAFAKAHLEPLVQRVNALAGEVLQIKVRLGTTVEKIDALKEKIGIADSQ